MSLEEDAGMGLVVPLQTSVGYGAQVLRQRRVSERDALIVQRVGGERKGVVGRGAAVEEHQRVACALAEVGVGGDLGGGGGGGGRWGCRAAAAARVEKVPHRAVDRWAPRPEARGSSCWAHGPGPLDSNGPAHELEKDL